MKLCHRRATGSPLRIKGKRFNKSAFHTKGRRTILKNTKNKIALVLLTSDGWIMYEIVLY